MNTNTSVIAKNFSKIVLNYTLFLHLYIFSCKILSVTIGKLNYSSIYNHNTI